MLSVLWLVFGSLRRLFRNRRDLIFENFVLRQQLTVLKRRRSRPALNLFDKLFWVAVSRVWSRWKQSIIVVTPETVVRWHRAGFRMYWRLLSRVRGPIGRRPTPKEVRELIFRMVTENPTWGAPRIHGELLMLGFDISERTISRWMKRAPRDPEPGKRWLAFLRNHQEVIAAMDFFTVPTISFGMLYCFFVIAHDRRRILHCNVTKHPASLWVVQQLREAFPFGSAPRFLIFDRDWKYGVDSEVGDILRLPRLQAATVTKLSKADIDLPHEGEHAVTRGPIRAGAANVIRSLQRKADLAIPACLVLLTSSGCRVRIAKIPPTTA